MNIACMLAAIRAAAAADKPLSIPPDVLAQVAHLRSTRLVRRVTGGEA